MRFIKEVIIYLVFGGMSSLYATDFLSENKETAPDIKSVGHSPEQSTGDLYRESYPDLKDSQLKNVKKIPLRQRLSARYRGLVLINLAQTTSMAEKNGSIESESANDDNRDEREEGLIDVYAKELLSQNAENTSPTLIDYERW